MIVGWSMSRFRQPSHEEQVLRLPLNPPDGGHFVYGNSVGGIALSPDGRTAAFVASGGGKSGLWVRPLDGATARLIAGTEGAAYPFWSPDSRSIAFFTINKRQRVDLVSGGTPSTICDTINIGRGGSWGDNGRILFGTITEGVFQVSASGGTPSQLTRVDTSSGEAFHRFPQFLPGGHFLYLVQGDKPEYAGVYAASLAKPEERVRLLTTDTGALYAPDAGGKGHLRWMRGGTLLAQEFDPELLKLSGDVRSPMGRGPHLVADPVAKIAMLGQMHVAVSANGMLLYSASNTSSQFTWLDRAGKTHGTVGEPGEYDTFSLSMDGRKSRHRSKG